MKKKESAVIVHEEYEKLLSEYALPEVIHQITEESIKKILLARSVQISDGIVILKKRRTLLKHQRESVMMRYGLGEIPKDVYELSKRSLDKDIDQLSAEITHLEKNSSNHQ